MTTSLERIREKIIELEAKIGDLRIAERELQALEKGPAPKPRAAPKLRQKRKPAEAETEAQPEARQTIGAAITDVLSQHGLLSVNEIAEHIKAAGRDINNRTISFSLQALKKRGLVKGADGKWMLPKPRAKRASA